MSNTSDSDFEVDLLIDETEGQPNKLDHEPYEDITFSKKWKMAKKIIFDSIPMILTLEAPMVTGLVNIYFLRDYGNNALIGGYGLGLHWNYIFLLSITLSLNQALAVLVSSAIGSKQFTLCSAYLQRGFLILLAFMIPCLLTLYFSEPIMLAIGVRDDLAMYAAKLTQLYLPSLFLYANFDMLKSFVVAHRDFYPILYIHLTSLAIHPLWAWLFIDYLKLEITGVAIARFLEECFNIIAIIIYIKTSDKYK